MKTKQTKKNTHFFVIEAIPYGIDVCLGINMTLLDFTGRVVKRFKITEKQSYEFSRGDCEPHGRSWFLKEKNLVLMWIQKWSKTNPASHGTFSHELAHAIQYICNSSGVKDDEAEAYLDSYLTQRFYEGLI